MILHLIETGGPGGAEQMLLRLSEEYSRRGHSQMVCLRKDGWLADEVRKRGIPLHITPLGSLPDIRWLLELRKVAERMGVTAIHAHEFAMNVRGALLGCLLGVPTVATVHGKNYYGEKWARRQAYKIICRLAKIVAVSADIKAFLLSTIGLPSKSVYTICNGIDRKKFQFDAKKRGNFRQNNGIGEHELLIGCVGSYYPVKGQKYLIAALKQIKERNVKFKAILVGQGPLEGDLRALVRELNLDAHVKIAGYVEDVQELLSALDIFVMPSLSEGQPLALLEAASVGCLIVATNVGGIPEIVKNGENGILVEPENAELLADAICETIHNKDKYRALGANAQRSVERNWSIEGTSGRYLSLLNKEK